MQHHEHVSLATLTTFHIDAPARYVIEARRPEDVRQACDTFGTDLLVLGGGSNILVTAPVERPILHMQIRGRAITMDDGNAVDITFGAGEPWHGAVEWLVDRGLGGLENLALIPGTVGAAPMQNIGAYGVEQERCFQYLTYVDLSTGKEHRIDHQECAFGYRDSVFKHSLRGSAVITSVTYRLHRNAAVDTSYADVRAWLDEHGQTSPTRKNIFEAIIDIRRSKLPDPNQIGNAGSFFKNPIIEAALYERVRERAPDAPAWKLADGRIKMPAAWFIDRCGWKGYRDGAIGVHHKQALVLINHGGGTGAAILDLARRIESSVYNTYGIVLEPEVQIWP
jgi:UDP-N-acetylmuramate dehydrogenase